jgi:hypothetical protein
LTAVGDDERGAAIERHLHSAGVTLLPGPHSLGRTAPATATLAPDAPPGRKSAHLRGTSDPSAASHLVRVAIPTFF